ncbi:MAG: transposase [Synergistaceae bacterium]|nr:transposase [Synergistaceae bacterium]
MRKLYDSDVSGGQLNQISRDLEFLKKKTRPRGVDLYDVVRVMFYLLKNACTWRNLPHNFPNGKLVNDYY